MMTLGFGELMFRVEVTTLEAKAQSLKYQPLGFWLQLVSGFMNGMFMADRVIIGIYLGIYLELKYIRGQE